MYIIMYMVCKRSLLACLVSIALLPVFVFAETQETIYDQALKAEEKGDIANALALFEKASNTEGPYTEEINEIIEVYKEALEIDESPWGLSFSAKISYAEISYKEEFLGQSETEHGKDLRFNAEVNLDYAMDNAMHSLGASFSTNWMISNEMPSLDTTKWSISPTIEYTLFLNDLLFNIGADFNIIEGDSLNIAPFTWTEVTLLHLDSQKFGIALWAYYRNDGYQTSTLYASWRYKSQNPLGSTVMIGAKFEADSVMNYSKKNNIQQRVNPMKTKLFTTIAFAAVAFLATSAFAQEATEAPATSEATITVDAPAAEQEAKLTKEEKDARKAEKKAAVEAKVAEKKAEVAARKAEKKAEIEAKKADKKAEIAAKKAEKAESKELRKAEKEARKAEKKAK